MSWSSVRYDAVRWHGAAWLGALDQGYPAVALVPRKTTVTRVQSEKFHIAEDGSVRISDVTAMSAYRLRIDHPYITGAQLAFLRAYFTSWAATVVRISDAEGRMFDCPLPREPDSVTAVTSVYYNVQLTLEGNLAT